MEWFKISEWFNIGIKHVCLCINFCWVPREVLKPEPERRGFQHRPRGPTDVNVSAKHVWSLVSWLLQLKYLEKMLRKLLLSCTYNGMERHVTCERFENTASRTKTYVILTSRNYVCGCARYWRWHQFLWRSRNLTCKTAKLCSNSTWFALLIHRFLSVNSVRHSFLFFV